MCWIRLGISSAKRKMQEAEELTLSPREIFDLLQSLEDKLDHLSSDFRDYVLEHQQVIHEMELRCIALQTRIETLEREVELSKDKKKRVMDKLFDVVKIVGAAILGALMAHLKAIWGKP